jgi:hypothetical protein
MDGGEQLGSTCPSWTVEPQEKMSLRSDKFQTIMKPVKISSLLSTQLGVTVIFLTDRLIDYKAINSCYIMLYMIQMLTIQDLQIPPPFNTYLVINKCTTTLI